MNNKDQGHASSSDDIESCMSRMPELDKVKLLLSDSEVHTVSPTYLWTRASSARLPRSQHFALSSSVPSLTESRKHRLNAKAKGNQSALIECREISFSGKQKLKEKASVQKGDLQFPPR